jgi:hypothetical protein
MNGRSPVHLVSVVSDRAEISELSAALMNTARKDWMTLETLGTEMPLTDDFAQPPLPALTGTVRCRSIYAASAMDAPAARQIIKTCTEAGEQARLLPAVPMKMKLADHTTAMLPLTSAGTAGALVVRAPVIIAALREYFELLWERATPLKASRAAAPGDRLTPAEQAVLELMAEGLHDDAICPPCGDQHDHRPPPHHGHHRPPRRQEPVCRRGSCPATGMYWLSLTFDAVCTDGKRKDFPRVSRSYSERRAGADLPVGGAPPLPITLEHVAEHGHKCKPNCQSEQSFCR